MLEAQLSRAAQTVTSTIPAFCFVSCSMIPPATLLWFCTGHCRGPYPRPQLPAVGDKLGVSARGLRPSPSLRWCISRHMGHSQFLVQQTTHLSGPSNVVPHWAWYCFLVGTSISVEPTEEPHWNVQVGLTSAVGSALLLQLFLC